MAGPAQNVLGRLTLKLINCQNHGIFRSYAVYPPAWLGGRPHIRYKGLDRLPKKEASLAERLAEEGAVNADVDIDKPVNIGIEQTTTESWKKKLKIVRTENKKNSDLEQAARQRRLMIPLDEVKEDWFAENGTNHLQKIAQHYGIFEDLFDKAYFAPVVPLNVCFDYDDDSVTPVIRGNRISPSEAKTEPHVQYESEAESLWTIVLTNPDGHLIDNNSEYLHWMVGNIPGDDLSQGELLCDYIQPFPPKGTGFHRYVFLLFKQSEPLDYQSVKRTSNCTSLKERTFKTVDFYRKYEDQLTPMGLSFFQSDWDDSVRDCYHGSLNMREPVFEYAHPSPYHPIQKMYPHKQPFDRYYDRYRDKKDIAEEVVRMKLDMISPFKPYKPKWKYPLVFRPRKYKPSWLMIRESKIQTRREQFRDLPK